MAVAVERSAAMVTAMLAVAKAGAACLPVDPAYPAARTALMLADADVTAVITTSRVAEAVPPPAGAPQVLLDDPEVAAQVGACPAVSPGDGDRIVPLRPAHPAYVLYVSGSAGVPQGVVGTNAALAGRLVWFAGAFAEWQRQVACARSSVSSIDGLAELVGPLLAGQLVVLADETEARDPAALVALMARHETECVTVVPGMLASLLANGNAGRLGSCGFWVSTGEALSGDDVSRLAQALPEARLLNRYGVTEAGGGNVVAECRDGEDVAIGWPAANTRVFVLDRSLRPVPPGVAGDLYLAGSRLARGYSGRPGLTGERFVACPFGPAGQRMYHTGDLVRWTANGRLVFVGRDDDQVRIGGLRVQPGEVAAVLAASSGVGRALVIGREDRPGVRQLVGYVVPEPGAVLNPADLREHAAGQLPEYMVPATVVVLDELPLLPGGKVDRAGLPAPDPGGPEDVGETREPETVAEEVLRGLFAEVLGVDQAGTDDSFFDLGGDSLMAIRLVARVQAVLGAEVTIRELFAAPTPAGVARAMDRASTARPGLRPAVRPDVLPLSFAQVRMWFLDQLEGGAAYNISLAMRLAGDLDVAALDAALADVAGRHESLRTVFPEVDGVPRQEILDPDAGRPRLAVFPVSEGDLNGAVAGTVEAGFDLAREVPWRVRLLRVSGQEHVLVLVVHHIAGDAWSMGVLAADISAAYAARLAGRAPGWGPLPVQYADYAIWQREFLGDPADPGSVMAGQLGFWREALAGAPAELALPTDRRRPAEPSYRGGRVEFGTSAGVHAGIVAAVRAKQATVLMAVQAAVAVLLARLGAGTDIPVGTAVAGRPDQALDGLVGFFVNTLVLRTDLSGDPSLGEVIGRVREAELAGLAHQDLPFDQLVEALTPERSLARHPLFQVMMVFQNVPRQPWRLPGLDVSRVGAGTGALRVDLSFYVWEQQGPGGVPAGLAGILEYADELFDASTAEAIADRLVRILEQVAADPEVQISRVELLDAAERRQLTERWNDTARAVPPVSVAALVEAQAARSPGAPAVVCGDVVLSYAELDAAASRLARYLIGLRGRARAGRGGGGGTLRGDGDSAAGGAQIRRGLPADRPGLPGRADRVHAGRRAPGGGADHGGGGGRAGGARRSGAGGAG